MSLWLLIIASDTKKETQIPFSWEVRVRLLNLQPCRFDTDHLILVVLVLPNAYSYASSQLLKLEKGRPLINRLKINLDLP
jgi:hypothetical protein